MPVRRGTYILTVRLDSPRTVAVGALGTISFGAGTYIYAGSAMGGLDQRVSRHLRRDKPRRWHIDSLTQAADRTEAYESYPDPVPECVLARMQEEAGAVPAADGFGCGDCSCRTHLFRDPGGSADLLVSRARLSVFKDSRASL